MLDGPGFNSEEGQVTFLGIKTFRLALVPTQLPFE